MKFIKISILLVVIGIFIIANAIYNSTKANNKTFFKVSADTKIDPN